MTRVLTTLIPPGDTEPWYDPSRPCSRCRAQVVKYRETPDGPAIDVLHAPSCLALRTPVVPETLAWMRGAK